MVKVCLLVSAPELLARFYGANLANALAPSAIVCETLYGRVHLLAANDSN